MDVADDGRPSEAVTLWRGWLIAAGVLLLAIGGLDVPDRGARSISTPGSCCGWAARSSCTTGSARWRCSG